MAFLEFTYKSKALKMNITVNVLLPEKGNNSPDAGAPEGTFKTLYLLHGVGANHADWVRKTNIERYAANHSIAVVMPAVERSWYADTAYGMKYLTFITTELPNVCRSYFKGMSPRREDNLIAGFSMGGYGAIKAALTCPDAFCACASLSGALDITRDGRTYDLEQWRGIFGYDLPDATYLKGTEHDIFALAEKNQAAGLPFPKLYMWCGTEDTLITANRKYHDLLNSMKIPHSYNESAGTHTWKYWDEFIQPALEYMLSDNNK